MILNPLSYQIKSDLIIKKCGAPHKLKVEYQPDYDILVSSDET